MKLNINETVRVTLTERGADIYNSYEAEYEKYTWYEAKPPKVAGDELKAQMWHLF